MIKTRQEHDHVMCRKVELELVTRVSQLFSFTRTTTTTHQVVSFIPSSTLVMWAKLSNALKYRHPVDEAEPSSSDVVSHILGRHPSVSEPHLNNDGESKPPEVPSPTHSPPGSPSKRNGVFRRLSRSSKHDSAEPSRTSSVLKLPLRLPKKVKSQMSLQTNGRRISARSCYDVHWNYHRRQFLKFPSTLFRIP